MIKVKVIFIITVIYCTIFLTSQANAKPDVPPFEEPYLEIGYKSIGEAIKECETANQRELQLPIKLPPIQFTHHLSRCVNDTGNYNDELQIEYLHETQGKNHYKIDVRPIEQRINFENSRREKKKLKLNDGSDALYFSTKNSKSKGGFNILVFEKNEWQYRLSVDSRIENQVKPDVLIGIANSLR
ncbi:hypothetical protein EV294_1273 [Paenibacillus sp. BK033]|uniref:hypothetical protein n=1 Tax=Paenibacillus sp. BK033 TaxID=2512133 RepID=UPI0010534CE1|nr:hypothetical protein [Paenibacillus sp. BK033]TCM85305.1 hypothetical protein EV294_1273 [Paenibacillus sp. BK033]